MAELYELVRQAIATEEPIATATLIDAGTGGAPGTTGAKLLVWPDGRSAGSLGDSERDAQVRSAAQQLLDTGATRLIEVANPAAGGQPAQVFIESFVPAPTLLIVGAVHIAIALVALANVMGFRTVVIDAREAFATRERFPHADELVTAWPDEALQGRLTRSSYVAVLTHDPKLDDPALLTALPSPARYVGALGSPSTHAKRVERLRAAGLSDTLIERLHAPIGLKIGARTPDEIALSIMAEMIQAKRAPR